MRLLVAISAAALTVAGCGGHVAGVRHWPPVPIVRARARHSLVIGRSVDGRAIRAIVIGDPGARRTVLVVGCIHGNEPAGIAIARRLAGSTAIPGTALWIVPDLNPDGVAANTRQNGHGVDLNRNFPYRWQRLSGYQYSGPHALSEPESRAAFRLIRRIHPRITIWFHQHATVVDLSGGNRDVEVDYASIVRLPAYQLIRYPGSAPGWENATFPGTTAFVVELPAGVLSDAAVRRHVDAVLRAAREVATAPLR